MPSSEQPIRSRVWILRGLGNSPAVMTLAKGHLALTSEEGAVFDAPLAEVREIKFPWYYFGGGVKLTVGTKRYRISFVRPNGAQDVPGRLLAGACARKKVGADLCSDRFGIEVAGEVAEVETAQLGIVEEVLVFEELLVLEEQVVHLPVRALQPGRLGGLRGAERVRMDLAHR